MKKFLINFICKFIPGRKRRKEFRKKMNEVTCNSHYYGKIYMPYYPDVRIDDEKPEIYNKDGQKMDVFFIRDMSGPHCPYRDSSKYFLWDRYNIGLKTHFYTHSAVLETMGNPDERYGLFLESESIIPADYRVFEDNKGLEKDFDAVFTYSERLLNSLDNAVFYPACASIWYGKEIFQGVKDSVVLDENLYKYKSKDVSMVCSAKLMTEMHRIRHRIATDAQKTGKVDIFGGFNGGEIFKYKSGTLKDYRFQIVVENDITPYYFTEKIMDCFVAMTIPVYLGATKINDFFNPDGIIKIEKNCDIEAVLKSCTKEEYELRQKAVIDNYYRSLMYYNINDLLYETMQKTKRR